MSAPVALDLASIPERIQSEVQRAIQRSIKGVEYIASSGPALGSTPKDTLHVRGTMNLHHYRPMADEIYRVPILIVMATTNRGYILDMVPGQSFIEFLLKRGYDVYMLDWTPPKPEEKSLRIEDYVLDFIPDCIRRVQQDSAERDVSVIGYCFGGVLSLLYGSIFNDGPMKNLICFTTPIDFRGMKLFSNFADRRYFDVDRLVDSVGNLPPEMILSSFEMLRPGVARRQPGTFVGKHLERRIRQLLSDVRSLGHRYPAAGRRVFPRDHQGPDVGQQVVQRHDVGRRPSSQYSQYQGADPARGRRARPHRAL
jgi:polyhydroxyalkanoate synthase